MSKPSPTDKTMEQADGGVTDNLVSEAADDVPTVLSGTKVMIMEGPLNILLFAIPLAFVAKANSWPDSVVFVLSLLSIAPMAERLGFVTEQLALHTNDTIGGLLNVTFGNATELIVAIAALNKGLYRVVQLTLLGSVLSNMLLVLGCAFLFGGLRHTTQYFNTISSQINMTMLMLAVMALLFPTVMSNSNTISAMGELGFSRATSIILIIMYGLFLVFQLITHREAYESSIDRPTKGSRSDQNNKYSLLEAGVVETPLATLPSNNSNNTGRGRLPSAEDVGYESVDELMSSSSRSTSLSQSSIANTSNNNSTSSLDNTPTVRMATTTSINNINNTINAATDTEVDIDDDDDDDEKDELGFTMALVWLAIITVLISFLSDYLVDTIHSAAKSWGMSALFLSAIVVPIIGNAAEHAGAVMFAMKNKVDLALAIAVGSSTQIALMVLPLLVIIGWMINKPLNLDFESFEASTLFLTVVTVAIATKDGSSTWLLGAILIGAYILIALGFFDHDDENLSG